MTLLKKWMDWGVSILGIAVLCITAAASMLWYLLCMAFCIVEIWAFVMIQAVRAFAWEIAVVVSIAFLITTY